MRGSKAALDDDSLECNGIFLGNQPSGEQQRIQRLGLFDYTGEADDSGHYTHYTQEQGCISLSCLANIAAALACSRRLQRGSVAAL